MLFGIILVFFFLTLTSLYLSLSFLQGFVSNRMTSKKGKIKEEHMLQLVPLSVEEVVTNQDLMKEIFLRVPVKSLIRFKCVSKQWFRQISNPQFAFEHFSSSRNLTLTSAIYFDKLYEIEARGLNHISLQGHLNIPTTTFLDDVAEGYTTTLVHSCHGLMLCKHMRPGDTVLYSVCNFTTQKFALFPQPGNNYYSYDSVLARLAFDPAKSPHYKVIFVRHMYAIYILSSETGSFKKIDVAAPNGRTFPHVALWDGAVHWMNDNKIYFRFEVDTEKFTHTSMPPKPKILKENQIRYFGECGGHLLLIQYRSYAQMGFRVLEMRKGTSVWTVMYRVNMRCVISGHPIASHNYHLLGVVKESNESGLALILLTSEKLISYNLKTKKVGVIAGSYPENFYRKNSLMRIHPYIESLFPVEFGPRILHD